MAKTYNNLFPEIYSFEGLYRAYLRAQACKRYHGDVLRFRQSLEENLIQLQNELIWKTYRTGEYRTFCIYEPKERLVAALPFRDRVLHHSLVAIIESIWERRFLYDSYACRKGKGTHAGADRVQDFLIRAKRKWRQVYCLKGDISKYFPSIDHNILKQLLRKRIACKDTLWLCDEIIDSVKELNNGAPKGVPIGNLTSQLFANVYLHELDEFIKHDLRQKYYVRYMDDFVILGENKAYLHSLRIEISNFLETNLLLKLNSKTQVFNAKHGINFLGYRIWPTHRLLRNESKRRMKRKLKRYSALYAEGKLSINKINASIQGWLGHCMRCNSYHLRRFLFDNFFLKKTILSDRL